MEFLLAEAGSRRPPRQNFLTGCRQLWVDGRAAVSRGTGPTSYVRLANTPASCSKLRREGRDPPAFCPGQKILSTTCRILSGDPFLRGTVEMTAPVQATPRRTVGKTGGRACTEFQSICSHHGHTCCHTFVSAPPHEDRRSKPTKHVNNDADFAGPGPRRVPYV